MTPEEFTHARREISDRLSDILKALFLGLLAWRDDDADEFVATAVPIVQGAQRMLALLVSLYMADRFTELTDVPVEPADIPDTAVLDLRVGVDMDEVYRRPFATVHAALAEGKTLPEAVQAGEVRLAQIAELDLQQTHAHAAQEALQQNAAEALAERPELGRDTQDEPEQPEEPSAAERDEPADFDRQQVGWRRVLQGEESCALCIVSSTQRYHIENLNPIHPECDCTVEPLIGEFDDRVIDPELLERVHQAVEELLGEGNVDRGGRAPDYRKILVKDHGELGPMLARPKDRFTKKKDLQTSRN